MKKAVVKKSFPPGCALRLGTGTCRAASPGSARRPRRAHIPIASPFVPNEDVRHFPVASAHNCETSQSSMR